MPQTSPWFDGTKLSLHAARGEQLGIQVLHRGGGAVTLTLTAANVHGFEVEHEVAKRASSDMYGGGTAGTYPDGLTPSAAPATDPAYFEIEVPRELAPGTYPGELAVDGRRVAAELTVAPVELPPLPIGAWAEFSRNELAWANLDSHEDACVAMFRDRGVLLSPPIGITEWTQIKQTRDRLAGAPFIPAYLVGIPEADARDVSAWIAATEGTGQVPFAIPIDEPRDPRDRGRVRALAQAVRDAGGGPGRFLYAVTDRPRPEYGDLVDLYVTLEPRVGDTFTRWTYNGAPPRAGSMVLDAAVPGARTWGWIAWRYKIPIWYVWDALYWHDRHNHKRDPEMGRPVGRGLALAPRSDATSFDSGDDNGNLDGVLALPGDATMPCRPTLRLEALRRGLQDRQLLELASRVRRRRDREARRRARAARPRRCRHARRCRRGRATKLAWETARRKLLALAPLCH